MFGRKSDSDKKLDAAKGELAAVRATLAVIDAKEAEVLVDGRSFALWRAERQAASTEVARIERLIDVMQAGALDALPCRAYPSVGKLKKVPSRAISSTRRVLRSGLMKAPARQRIYWETSSEWLT